MESDFACRCSPKARKECNQVMREVCTELSHDKIKVTRRNLLTHVVYSLEWKYSAEISGIPCDQWCGISAATHDNDFQVFVQCDEVEDGIAFIYKAFMERYPDGYQYDVEQAKAERAAGR